MSAELQPLHAPDSPVHLWDFGVLDYADALALQHRLVNERIKGLIPDTLLVGEHLPVITCGRGTHPENLFNPSIPVVEAERGGDVTYHAPGQLILYPIVFLAEGQRNLHQCLRDLESLLIDHLTPLGVQAMRHPPHTGVWIQTRSDETPKKIASIGLAVRRWVTYHGMAINLCPDMAGFQLMNPCGLPADCITSLAETYPAMEDWSIRVWKERLAKAWCDAMLAKTLYAAQQALE